ncbi:hypothetical protein K502DRAFT_306542 [Neoconidiobolus thromboides FSU 785]|nr:hypothetical protein K502DRAFT_306542 [Neoconidiobolus thromboides FSU 785]
MEPENNQEYLERTKALYSTVKSVAQSSANFNDPNVLFGLQLDPEGLGLRLYQNVNRLLQISNRLLVNQGLSNIKSLNEEDLYVSNFEKIVEVLDNSYDRVNTELDSLKKSKKAKLQGEKNGDNSEVSYITNVDKANLGNIENKNQDSFSLLVGKNVTRPQTKFNEKLSTDQYAQFVSLVYRLGIKYHAMKPLTKTELELCKGKKSVDIDYTSASNLPNPYEFEINNISYPEHMTKPSEPTMPKSLQETKYKVIKEQSELEELIKELEKEQTIAVDLEHHDYRSYHGFVCLMQLSTSDCDYIIDTLELRKELFELNRIFANPNIVKVFHGADQDIIWLQRDFGIYVVNMFDTYHASCALQLEKKSLAYLLKKYVNFDANKAFQLADWRVRPLPKPMLDYAKSDTHFLIYIYETMKNELIQESNAVSLNLLFHTLTNSQQVCLQRFMTYPYDMEHGLNPGSWAKQLEKWIVPINFAQTEAFKQLHAWRDHLAREQDESPRYILPGHMLYALALKLPKDSAEVLACTNPIPPAIRMYASDLAILITAASNSSEAIPSSFVPSTKIDRGQVIKEKEEEDPNLLAKVELPIAKSLKGKTIKELCKAKVKTVFDLDDDSKFFGGSFFAKDRSLEYDEQITEVGLALIDQIKANLSYNVLPPSVEIEVSLNCNNNFKSSN